MVDIDKLKCRSCGGDFLRTSPDAAPTGPTAEEKRRSLMKSVDEKDAKKKVALSKKASGDASSRSVRRLRVRAQPIIDLSPKP